MGTLLDRCPVCSSERVGLLWTAEDVDGKTWRYDKCGHCGDIYLNPPLTTEQMDEYYGPGYYGPGHERFGKGIEKSVLFFRKARARRAARLMPKGGAILDVGCGRGLFLEILARRGYGCLGTERDEPAARDAAIRVPVKVGDIEKLDLPEGSFDLVTLWQVIEHLSAPRTVIAACARLLKNGGRMLVQVPNPESPQARAGGPYWFHLDPPRHTHIMPLGCLDMMARQSGLDREKYTTLNFEYAPFGILQTLYNLMGMKRDLLYETLMSGGKNSHISGPAKAALKIMSVAAAPLAASFAMLESAAGLGGVIEAVYRKSGA